MNIDIEKIMILLQRKYTAVREIGRLTKELEGVLARNDEVSAAMILQMRGDEMEKAERCMEEIWQMGEEDRAIYEKLRVLVTSDPEKAVGESKEEEKIYEIRRKTKAVLEEVRKIDRRLNTQVAGEKSFYKSKEAAYR